MKKKILLGYIYVTLGKTKDTECKATDDIINK